MNVRILKLLIFLIPALILARESNDFKNSRTDNLYISFNPEMSAESDVIFKSLSPIGFRNIVTSHPKFIQFKFKIFSKNGKNCSIVFQLKKGLVKLKYRLIPTSVICIQEYILSGTCMTRAP